MYVKEVLYIQVVHCGSENRQKMVWQQHLPGIIGG